MTFLFGGFIHAHRFADVDEGRTTRKRGMEYALTVAISLCGRNINPLRVCLPALQAEVDQTSRCQPTCSLRDPDGKGVRGCLVAHGPQRVLAAHRSNDGKTRRNTMKHSSKDQAEGKFHKAKGKIKETAGKLLDDPDLETEGKVEKITGKLQEKIGQVEKVVGK